MNEAEKNQRIATLTTCGMVCAICGKQLTAHNWQGAHRIANTIQNRKKWGDFIIDHPFNIAMVCSLGCNSKCNIGNNPGECARLLKKIADAEVKKYRGTK